jgi:phosphatidylglycerol:prolipoprotein diacylglycerol transferase
VGYGGFRFAAEYFRQPDDFLGLLALNLSMGQWLCLPMVGVGLVMWLLSQSKGDPQRAGASPGKAK